MAIELDQKIKQAVQTWRERNYEGAIPEDITEGVKGPRVRQNRPEFLRLMGKGRKHRVHRILPEVEVK